MLAFSRDGEYTDIWLLDTTSGVTQRLTFEAANKYSPVWSPDGRRIVFSWDPKGVLDLYEKPLDSAGNGTLLWSSAEHKYAQDWSMDGRFLLYTTDSAKTGWDLWALPLVGDKKPLEVAHTAFTEIGRTGSHLTAVGSPISRTRPDGMRSTSSRSPARVARSKLRAAAARRRNGAATGASSFTWRLTGVWMVPITMNGSAIETESRSPCSREGCAFAASRRWPTVPRQQDGQTARAHYCPSQLEAEVTNRPLRRSTWT